MKKADFAVWPGNWDIVNAFCAVASQWRTISLASGKVWWEGLDYAAVRAGLGFARIRLTPDQWRGLQVMERAAADALNGYQG